MASNTERLYLTFERIFYDFVVLILTTLLIKEHFWTIIRALVLLSSVSFRVSLPIFNCDSKHEESLFRYPADREQRQNASQLLTKGGESRGYGSSHGEA